MGKTYMIRKGFVVIISLLCIGTTLIAASAQEVRGLYQPILNRNTLYVGGSGPNNYTSIQSAINNASNYYTIFVYNGTYYEHLVVNKRLVINGEDRNSTIIDGNGTGDVILITSMYVNITRFTIRNSGDITLSGNPDAGIFVNSYYINILENIIINNRYGIYIQGGMSHMLISNNRITNNRGDGINLYSGSGRITISDNIIANNDQQGASGRGGISMFSSNNNIISGNTITNNSGWGNIDMANGCYGNIITENNIEHDVKGIYIYPSCHDNIFSYNWFHNSGIGIYIKSDNEHNLIFCNNFTNNSYGIWFDKYSSVNNTIFHNNFMNNMVHAIDPFSNYWDDGYPSGGNFWDDYTGSDTNGDRIGDTPYAISYGNNADHYPLMFPYGPPSAYFEYTIINRSVLFDASYSYDYDGNITNYFWVFGDGTNGTGMIISHDYEGCGDFFVTLTVVNDDGMEDDVTQTICIIPIPDLECTGALSWTDIESGSTITGSFTIENIGEPKSHLNWEIQSWPEWGTFSFNPIYGYNLTPENGSITVNVTVSVPLQKNADFSGNVTIINSENSSDYDTIQVHLTTPYNIQWTIVEILHTFIERFPNAFPILRYLLGFNP
jgi:nitrous oxidase accessory protein NosD